MKRSFDETRPFTLRNTDNKTVAGVSILTHKFAVAKSLCPLQRGFIAGRLLGDHVSLLDVVGHAFALDIFDA